MKWKCGWAVLAAAVAVVWIVWTGGEGEPEDDWGGAAVDWAWRREGNGVTLLRKLAKRQDLPVVRKNADCFFPVTQYVGAVKMPETVGGMPVRALGDSLCVDAQLLEAVKIPSSVRKIGLHAFKSTGARLKAASCWRRLSYPRR